jgi:acyl-coenzyme A synthetase/AMP-(fatty) acid ligase
VARRLREALAALVPELRPKVVLFGGGAIPRTHTGKIQRRRLASLFARYRTWQGAPVVEPASRKAA